MDNTSKRKLRECLLVSRHLLECAAIERCKRAMLPPFYFDGARPAFDANRKPQIVEKASEIRIAEVTPRARTQKKRSLPDSKIQSK